MEMEMGKKQERENVSGFGVLATQYTCVSQAKNLIKHRVPSRMLRLGSICTFMGQGIIFYSGIKLFWLSPIISAFSLCLLWFFCCPPRNANQITRNVYACVRMGWGWGASQLLLPARTGLLPPAAEALLSDDTTAPWANIRDGLQRSIKNNLLDNKRR